MQIPFTKMHGLGNNYIYINLFDFSLNNMKLADLAVRMSDPNTGIGSDGLILIGKSDVADVSMRIFNQDGSEAKNCGNGLRCVAKYAYERHLVEKKEFSIETLSGIVQAKVEGLDKNEVQTITIDMGAPILKRANIPMTGEPADQPVINETVKLLDEDYTMTALSMGNPHAILFIDHIEKAPLHALGAQLSDGHSLFPDGVNIGYVEKTGENSLRYRVWERGSGITQACGTGACAAAVAAVLTGKASKGETITVTLDGGSLYITWDPVTNHVFMKGSAAIICEGHFCYQ